MMTIVGKLKVFNEYYTSITVRTMSFCSCQLIFQLKTNNNINNNNNNHHHVLSICNLIPNHCFILMLTDTLKTGIYIAFLKDEQWRIREAE